MTCLGLFELLFLQPECCTGIWGRVLAWFWWITGTALQKQTSKNSTFLELQHLSIVFRNFATLSRLVLLVILICLAQDHSITFMASFAKFLIVQHLHRLKTTDFLPNFFCHFPFNYNLYFKLHNFYLLSLHTLLLIIIPILNHAFIFLISLRAAKGGLIAAECFVALTLPLPD